MLIATRLLAMTAALSLLPWATLPAAAQVSGDVVKIGILTDMSGQFSENTGEGSVLAARMAIGDYGGTVRGHRIDLVSADHQNRADTGSAIAREWFDRDGVDLIADLVNSSVALSVMKVAKAKDRITFVLGSGSTRISNEDCTDTNVQWTYDTFATATTIVKSMIAEGKDTWFFITADYSFGQSTERDASAIITAAGGRVVGSVKHPSNTADFASFLLQAQASGAKVIALASAGADAVNAIKQAGEFGLTEKQSLVGFAAVINDIHGLGLRTAQNMYLTERFYWDANAATRAFAARFFERMKKMPNMVHFAMYSAITHYLKAIDATNTDATGAVMAQMRAVPVDDKFTTGGIIRPDGLMVHDMYLFQVKRPEQSKYPWDYYVERRRVPGVEAFAPLSASRCPLVARP
ncbi:MAG: ABC transporter substrate-binding protein [Xanthobacteraceae bacterium]|nr:ABC transporter substrate-binding protein [Xanthobacteraceae bacterium]